MAKFARERALQEKRERKQQKKDARKQAAAAEKAAEQGEATLPDEPGEAIPADDEQPAG